MLTEQEKLPLVLVTGAAGGLGSALVEAFAPSFRVAAAFHSQAIKIKHHNIVWSGPVEVQLKDSVEKMTAEIERAHGPVTVLVNNFGGTIDGLVSQLSDLEWQAVMQINLKGSFLCSQAVWPGMSRQGGGHILHISSFAARNGTAGQAPYAAAKAGLIGLMTSLAREGADHNIRSNAILPGVLDSGMTKILDPVQLARLTNSNLLKRSNDLGEVAHFILHLASMKNVSGQVFQLDSRIAAWT